MDKVIRNLYIIHCGEFWKDMTEFFTLMASNELDISIDNFIDKYKTFEAEKWTR